MQAFPVELLRTFPLVLVSHYRHHSAGLLEPINNGFLCPRDGHSNFGHDQLICRDQTYQMWWLMERMRIQIPLRTRNPPETNSGSTPVSVSARVLHRAGGEQGSGNADPSGREPTVVFTVVGNETLARVFPSDLVEQGRWASIRT